MSRVQIDGGGARGFDATDGDDGLTGAGSGGNGRDGGNATQGSQGYRGSDVTIQIMGGGRSLDGSESAVLYVSVSVEGSSTEEESQIRMDRDSVVSVAANGGSGGNGGRGGEGGPGVRGHRGANATRVSSGRNGGPGGDGGEGGRGSNGASGGSGGTIRIHVSEAETHLLMAFDELNVRGGKGGKAGRHGNGGPGGPGGRGGDSKTWHTGSGDNRRRHHKPGGHRGVSGRTGRTPTFSLQDGAQGSDGKVEIIVRHLDGSSTTYPSIYDLQLVSLDLREADRYDCIFEFGELIKCSNIVVRNVGGMPSPSNHPMFVRLKRDLKWFACPDGGHHYQGLVAVQVDDDVVAPSAQVEQITGTLEEERGDSDSNNGDSDIAVADIVGSSSFFLCVAGIDPGQTLSVAEDKCLWLLAKHPETQVVLDSPCAFTVSAQVFLECGMVGINRTFPSFHGIGPNRNDVLTLQYPMRISGYNVLSSLGRNQASKLDIEVRNVSPTLDTSDRRVIVRARAVQTRDRDISQSEWIEGHEMLRISFNRNQADSKLLSLAQGQAPAHVLGTIPSDSSITIAGGVKLGKDVPSLSRFEIRIILEMNNIETPVTGAPQAENAELDMRVVQVIRFPLCLGESYTHVDNALGLLVVNQNLIESNQVAWQEAFKTLGLTQPDVWDTAYNGAPADWHASAEPLVNYRDGTVVMFYEDLFLRQDLMDALHHANIDLILVFKNRSNVLCQPGTPFFIPSRGDNGGGLVTLDINALRAMDPENFNKLWDFRVTADIKAVRKALKKCQLPYWQGVAEEVEANLLEDEPASVRVRRLPDFNRGRFILITNYGEDGVPEECFRALCDGITFSVRLELLVAIEKERGEQSSDNSVYIEASLLADLCTELDRWYERLPKGLSSKDIFQGMLFWSSAVAVQSKYQSVRLAEVLNRAFYYLRVFCGRRLALFGFRGMLSSKRAKLKQSVKQYGMRKILSKPSLKAAAAYFERSTQLSWFAKKKAAAMRRQMSPHTESGAVKSSSRIESLQVLNGHELRSAWIRDSTRARTVNAINTSHAATVSELMLETL